VYVCARFSVLCACASDFDFLLHVLPNFLTSSDSHVLSVCMCERERFFVCLCVCM